MSPSPEEPVEGPVPPPAGVGRTALGVARIRAAESARADRLFDDPFAAAFVEAADGAPPPAAAQAREQAARRLDDDSFRLVRWLAFYTAIRTRFYDDWLAGATASGCRQVVLVAAGLDTRAYRLGWPEGTRLVELDQPAVLDFKQAVLDARGARPRCERTVLRLDLRDDWRERLRAAGLDPARPVAWLVEGLLIYLGPDEARTLLERITSLSAPGSRLACEGPSPRQQGRDAAARPALGGYTDLWRGGLGDQLPPTLRELGWDVATHDRDDVAAGYGRTGPGAGGASFVTAVRGTA